MLTHIKQSVFIIFVSVVKRAKNIFHNFAFGKGKCRVVTFIEVLLPV